MQLHLCNSSDPNCKGFDAFLQTVCYMEKFGIDVGIGHVIGDPPIHPLFTLRTQMLDLHYSRMMEKSGFLRIKWGLENLNDIHHDLSTSRFDHLEFPWGLFNLKSNNGEALRLIELGHFSNGDGELFRPLLNNLTGTDPFFVMADFADYLRAQDNVSRAWQDNQEWNRMSLL